MNDIFFFFSWDRENLIIKHQAAHQQAKLGATSKNCTRKDGEWGVGLVVALSALF
jgi:hypothetical protein